MSEMPGQRSIAQLALVVRDYDEAIRFYCDTLGFTLVEDTPHSPEKRWVVVRPGSEGPSLLLAKAANAEQETRIGNQTGGRVFLFIDTDDCRRDHARFKAAGVEFEGEPRVEDYGVVAVFKDLYGNRWDMVERIGR